MKQIQYFEKEEVINCVHCRGRKGMELREDFTPLWEYYVALNMPWGLERSLGQKPMNLL